MSMLATFDGTPILDCVTSHSAAALLRLTLQSRDHGPGLRRLQSLVHGCSPKLTRKETVLFLLDDLSQLTCAHSMGTKQRSDSRVARCHFNGSCNANVSGTACA